MKTSIEVSEKTAKTILIIGSALFVAFFVAVALFGDLGSIYSAF